MKIVSLSDVHGDIGGIERVAGLLSGADLVVLAGDITHFGHREDAAAVVETVRKYNGNLLAVSGNCDYSGVDLYLSDEGINLHGQHVICGGVCFAGLGASLVTPFNTPNELSEDDYLRLCDGLSGIPADMPLVLVSHQPPYDTLTDRLDSGVHVGSQVIRSFIERREPVVCLTGHIHESAAIDSLGGSKIVNPGPLGQGHCAVASVNGAAVDVEIVAA